MTDNEREELRVLASNVRDDRLRGLIFQLLEDTSTPDIRAPVRGYVDRERKRGE